MRPRCSEEPGNMEPGTTDGGGQEEPVYVSMNGLKGRREETAEKRDECQEALRKVGKMEIKQS